MNHNDINRQCAEILGWRVYNRKDAPEYYFHTPPGEIQVRINDFVHPCPDFRNGWNAMKLLKEYANERDFALCLSEGTKGSCCAEFASRKVNGGYFCDYADTFTEAVALAFLKCFGKDKNND
jgi:hypothetical protein